MSTLVRAYWFPLTLFALSLFFQLIVLPRSYPPSHYDVLGIKRLSSVEDVSEAYHKLSSKWLLLLVSVTTLVFLHATGAIFLGVTVVKICVRSGITPKTTLLS